MSTTISQLAQKIAENTAVVEGHLLEKGERAPSLDANAPSKLATTGEAEFARMKAIDTASELIDVLKGPAELLRFDWTESSSLRVIVRLKIAALVPSGGEISFAELAEKLRLPTRDVQRILRHAMVRHIFIEPRKGYVAHTALSRLLAEDEHQFAIASTLTDVFLPALIRLADAVETWPGSEEANQTGFSLTNDSGKTLWQTFAENEDMSRRFGLTMGYFGGINEGLVREIEWKGKVVDVGGSHGDGIIEILRLYPQVTTAVVQDLPDVVKIGQARAPADVAQRLHFEAHDFFTAQTQSADMFFFRWVFHNWSNKYSVEIIRNLVPVMKPGTRIVVNDFLLPEPNTLPLRMERAIRTIDMTMLGLLNATERDASGWHELFREADPRFIVKKIKTASSRIMAIIEVEWQPEQTPTGE